LAKKVKGYVKIAYWDTEKSGSAPGILGEIKGTPTIKLLKPKRKAKTNKQKDVVDYNMERKVDAMSTFALDLMPSFVERINGPEEFEKFKIKAEKYGLPMFLFFSSDRRIGNEMKYFSTEYRRRVLIAQIAYTKKENKSIFLEYGVRGQALLVVPPSTTANTEDDVSEGSHNKQLIAYDGKWNLHRLQTFFTEHALKSEVKAKLEASSKMEEKMKDEAVTKENVVKTEL
jgi:hypothetical protein